MRSKKTKCYYCPETEPMCIDFHHPDPKQKSFNIGINIIGRSYAVLEAEIAKCICLCRNCHSKYHAGLLPEPVKTRQLLQSPVVVKNHQKKADSPAV